jgi:outer membrane protein OmpA-like peptidoglycan-associated protein
MDAAAATAQASEAERERLAAESARLEAEREKSELRSRLRQQLEIIFETRDTARGLILSMSNVLFDTARATLKPGARERLSKLAGVVLSNPGLQLAVEGHADSVGNEEYNQDLSERRANSVRDYLVGEGISAQSITARGFGESMPIASNDTPEGRQQNRRVEIVVSGDVIAAYGG